MMKNPLAQLRLCLMLLPLLLPQIMNANPDPHQTLFDFAAPTNSTWQIINDEVMGGRSASQFEITNGVAVFRGTVSLANNGGFASVRSQPAPPPAESADCFLFRVRGDGRTYKFTARMRQNFEQANYQCAFPTKPGAWQELRVALKDFKPSFRGRNLSGEPPLTATEINSVGFLISDQQSGAFQLEVAWIKLVRSIPK